MKLDIYIKVRFKTTAEGSRKTSVKHRTPMGTGCYACPLIVDDKTSLP